MRRIGALALLLALLGPAAAAAQVTPLPVDLSGGLPVSEEGYLSQTAYEDESIRVDIETCEVRGTKCYIARVTIADPSQLRTAPAYSFTRDQTAYVSDIAARVNAVLAINGDYFSFQNMRGGYLVRQGELYNDQPIMGRDVLIIDGHGDLWIEPVIDDEVIARHEEAGIVNAFNFGPGLVVDGQVLTEYTARYNTSTERTQRCCLAQVERGRLEYLCICCEGSGESEKGGMTIVEFAEFVSSLGVQNAYNLDGGNSTAMIFHGEKINAVTNRKHRPLSDIVYFASAAQQ